MSRTSSLRRPPSMLRNGYSSSPSAPAQGGLPIGGRWVVASVMDTVNALTRSSMMSRVRSRGNRSTERRLRAHLVRSGLRGWRLHAAHLPGKPDFAFAAERLVVFVDGCFWHGCADCADGHNPRSNTTYWLPKIQSNRDRDRRNTALLRRLGWCVVRVWEHEISTAPERILIVLRKKLAARRTFVSTARSSEAGLPRYAPRPSPANDRDRRRTPQAARRG